MVVQWGIIGCGDVCEKKSGPALAKVAGSCLHAVMRRDIEKARDFASRHGAKEAYSTVEELLSDPVVDAVYIATPPHVHCEHVLAAAKAGKRRILVEKPMGMNAAECARMIECCRAAGASLHVAYYRRYYPKFQRAKQLLDSGAIGRILGARLQMCATSAVAGWRIVPEISGGGYFLDVGSHRLDMLTYLLGDVAEAHGAAANLLTHHGAENDVVASLRFASGVVASASFHYHTNPSRDVLEVYGSTGTLSIDPFDGDVLRVLTGGGIEEIRIPVPSPTHLPFVQALVDEYSGRGSNLVTGEEGAKVTRVMDAILSRSGPAGVGAGAAERICSA